MSAAPLGGGPAALRGQLERHGYIADEALATTLHVALSLEQPLLLEGSPGVGKTEVAKALAAVRDARLIRLQCYDGIDLAHAVYDWNYSRQMLYVQMLKAGDAARPEAVADLFGREFLVRRPLLEAIENDDPVPPVLLIDEIDRADEEFEAYLLELLSDFQVTVPEFGTVTAERRPVVILTSNRTREMHDALRRRCLYHWLGLPEPDREIAIVRARVPGADPRLVREGVAYVGMLRKLDLVKSPGVAETLDWLNALSSLRIDRLTPAVAEATAGSLLKHHDDLLAFQSLDPSEYIEPAAQLAAD